MGAADDVDLRIEVEALPHPVLELTDQLTHGRDWFGHLAERLWQAPPYTVSRVIRCPRNRADISQLRRCCRCTATLSPIPLPRVLRSDALSGTMWVPSPIGSSVAWKGLPSMVPATLTALRVAKMSPESGMATHVHPLFASVVIDAVNVSSMSSGFFAVVMGGYFLVGCRPLEFRPSSVVRCCRTERCSGGQRTGRGAR